MKKWILIALCFAVWSLSISGLIHSRDINYALAPEGEQPTVWLEIGVLAVLLFMFIASVCAMAAIASAMGDES